MTYLNKHLAKAIPFTETKFGVEITDNYRYFEDTKNKEALNWIKKESDLTQDFLNEENLSNSIFEALKKDEELFNFQIQYLRIKKEFYFYAKRKATEDKAKIYRCDRNTNIEELLIDLEKLQNFYPTQNVDFMVYSISPNEKYMAILFGLDGNEFGNTHIYNLETKRFEADIHENTRSFEVNWISDIEYLYVCFPNAYKIDGTDFKDSKIKYHKIGTPIEDDFIVISAANNPEILDLGATNWLMPHYIKESNTLIVYHGRDTENILSLYTTQWQGHKTEKLKRLNSFEDKVLMLTIKNNFIYFFCTKFNENYELRKSPLKKFNVDKSELLFSKADEFPTLEIVSDKKNIYFTTNKNGYNNLYTINKNDEINLVEFEEKCSINFPESFALDTCPIYTFSLKKPSIGFTLENGKLNKIPVFKDICKEEEFLNNLVSFNLEFTSYDGTMVPISIVHHKDLKKDGLNKCLINAYGSYGYSYLNYFETKNLYWLLKVKGVLAIAHVRGGGEKGQEWHLEGKKENKSNTWKDLIAAGEFLVAEKYTSSDYMACQGTSAGGITVGMTANTRPELFKSIISNVGSNTPSRRGRNPGGGLSEFGNPDLEEDFKILLKMDTFENIIDKPYPNILLAAGMKDDRVDYWQPAKAAAKFKKHTTSNNTIAYIAYENFGHGWSGSKDLNLKFWANQMAFLEKTLK